MLKRIVLATLLVTSYNQFFGTAELKAAEMRIVMPNHETLQKIISTLNKNAMTQKTNIINLLANKPISPDSIGKIKGEVFRNIYQLYHHWSFGERKLALVYTSMFFDDVIIAVFAKIVQDHPTYEEEILQIRDAGINKAQLRHMPQEDSLDFLDLFLSLNHCA